MVTLSGVKEMAGNELKICKFVLAHLGNLNLKHIGVIKEIATPIKQSSDLKIIKSEDDLSTVSTQDSWKKADIYLNRSGVSIKQIGGSFAFNRLQRANIVNLYQQLEFTDIENKLTLIAQDIKRFHQGLLNSRNVPWQNYLSELDFKELLKFLMLTGSPNQGISSHPAQYILEAPSSDINQNNISLYSFDEYFELYKSNLSIAIRRQWIGQNSNSEHKRALSLAKKVNNSPWVFNEVVGQPRSGWRDNFPKEERKTVYFLMIEKK
ncbi:conserved hypothetical protein [Hyella patelloides LEGE 07179]|uniref:Uncharacterized protein n=1 Tax=Hyella patelloides LEGE 07179 TaxID=945734 RepID=A0A563VKY7_9CYAN|nr:hypothetical protein [Hyella patelloides]VEP12114.1 conserved hypothetical protein [Hyella patelloides LEGE 07179]